MQFLEQLYPRFWSPSTCTVQVVGAGCVAAHCCGPLLAEKTLYPIGPGKDVSSMCTKRSPVGTIVKWENHSGTCPSPHWILHIMDFPLIQQPLAGLQPPGTQDVFIFELCSPQDKP